MQRILILGGTQEANELAKILAQKDCEAIYSYAGRTQKPKPQPIPIRTGGFGGVRGMIDYLESHEITHIVDATHPFAAQISSNAVQASKTSKVPLMRFERPSWEASEFDSWIVVHSIDEAVEALDGSAERIFLAIGKQEIAPFMKLKQHFFLLRFVDLPGDELIPQSCEIITDKGPFTLKNDVELLKRYEISKIVSKNSGGAGARAKIDAARELGLPVIMIDRPAQENLNQAHSPGEILDWLGIPVA